MEEENPQSLESPGRLDETMEDEAAV